MGTTTAARTTATATGSPWSRLCLAGALALLLLSGCGAPEVPAATPATSPTTRPFAWFRAGPAPSGWGALELPERTALLSLPPGAQPVQGDSGSISAQVTSPGGDVVAYFNSTPQQGGETLAGWPGFRLAHLAEENGGPATALGALTGMAFRGGTGSCIEDSYLTRTGARRYDEIACFVQGPDGGSVLVVAAPAAEWAANIRLLEQAVDSYAAE